MIRLLLTAALLLAPAAASAQSAPHWGQDYIPSAGEWDLWWSKKLDAVGGAFTGTSLTNPTIAGGSIRLGIPGWLTAIVPNTETNTAAYFASTFGGNGVTGACRTSDNSQAGSQGCQGVTRFAINDNFSAVQTAYGAYIETRRNPGAGVTQGIESNLINQGSLVPVTSYSELNVGLTAAGWLSCGRPDVPASTPCSLALAVVNNGYQGNAPFAEGIVFHAGSLTMSGGIGYAMDLAQSHALVWREPSTRSVVFQVRSDASVPGGGGQVVAANDGVHFQTAAAYDVAISRTDGRWDFMGATRLQLFNFATIPAASINGRVAFCNDCLNTARGDTAGHGTGTVLVDTGSAWIAIPGAAPAH